MKPIVPKDEATAITSFYEGTSPAPMQKIGSQCIDDVTDVENKYVWRHPNVTHHFQHPVAKLLLLTGAREIPVLPNHLFGSEDDIERKNDLAD